MGAIVKSQLENASLDAESFAQFTNGADNVEVLTRLGQTYPTIAKLVSDVYASAEYLIPVAYAAGINLTTPNQTVEYLDTTYAPLLNELPFTTSGTFETAKFRVIQGVSRFELVAPDGSSIIGADDGAGGSLWTTVAGFITKIVSSTGASVIGFVQDASGAIFRSVSSKLGESVSIADFDVDLTGVVDSTAGMQEALAYAYASGKKLIQVPGTVLVRETLFPQSGVSWTGCNGRLTGLFRKTKIITDVALNPIIDTSNLKYGEIGSFNLDGGGVAVSGLRGTNVFGMVAANMRASNFTDVGFELMNDGAGVGCYSNVLRKLIADACVVAGFRLNSSGGDINHNLLDHCVSTDTQYGFLENGTFGGRSNTYRDCNTERCSVRGMEINTTSFNIRGGYHEFNNTNILIDNANLVTQQGGIISGVSMLGSYGFSGAPNAYESVGIQVNSAENVTIDSVWYAYLKTGNSLTGTTKNTQIRNPFFNYSNVETFLSDSNGMGTSITSGGQHSKRVRGAAANIVATPEYGNLIYVDNGNNNYTVTVDATKYELGHGHEVMTLMSSGNTGTVVISDSSGATFFGQSGGSRVSGVASLTLGRGDVAEIRKTASNQWFVKWSNSQI